MVYKDVMLIASVNEHPSISSKVTETDTIQKLGIHTKLHNLLGSLKILYLNASKTKLIETLVPILGYPNTCTELNWYIIWSDNVPPLFRMQSFNWICDTDKMIQPNTAVGKANSILKIFQFKCSLREMFLLRAAPGPSTDFMGSQTNFLWGPPKLSQPYLLANFTCEQ
jgi:hypothetical protein